MLLLSAHDLEGRNEDERMFALYRKAIRYAMIHQYLIGRLRGDDGRKTEHSGAWREKVQLTDNGISVARILARLLFGPPK